jgi:hypothetical protein
MTFSIGVIQTRTGFLLQDYSLAAARKAKEFLKSVALVIVKELLSKVNPDFAVTHSFLLSILTSLSMPSGGLSSSAPKEVGEMLYSYLVIP